MTFYRFPSDASPLTKGEIAALRQCDVVSFHHTKEHSFINATMRASDSRPFEDTRRVHCNTLFNDYSKREENISPQHMECFEMIHSPRMSEEWITIVGLLREGDILTLVWARDALRSPVLDEAGMCSDQLSLDIQRGEKAKHLRFTLDTYCGANNTARMIHGPRKAEGEY